MRHNDRVREDCEGMFLFHSSFAFSPDLKHLLTIYDRVPLKSKYVNKKNRQIPIDLKTSITQRKIDHILTIHQAAAPKNKYLDPLVRSTLDKSAFHEVMMYLDKRLGDSAWTIVYKSLIVIHTMIREGERDVVLKYLSHYPDFLSVPQMRKMNDTNSLVPYAKYLGVRGKEFGSVKFDYVRDYQVAELNRTDSRLKKLTVDRGLLREVESVLKQIKALVSTRFTESNITNDVTLTSFRLTVNDLLILFNVLNIGVINILEHFFEMSRYDAERGLEIYREYCILTGRVVDYLKVAKHMEYATKLHIPTLKHAPISLVENLEDYLQNGGPEGDKGPHAKNNNSVSANSDLHKQQAQYQEQLHNIPAQQQNMQQLNSQPTTNPFFQQIQQQTSAQVQPAAPLQPQPTNNPFLQQQIIPVQIVPGQNFQLQQQQLPQVPMQSYATGQFSSVHGLTPAYTGAGFGGYTPQQQQQPNQIEPQQQQPATPQPLKSSQTGNNPFALSYKPTGTNLGAIAEQPTNNPFALKTSSNVEASNPQIQLQQHTNPFSLTSSANPNVQNSTQQQQYNSNRISLNPQPTMGGYENLQTTPVFPSTIQEQRTGGFVQNANMQLQTGVVQTQYTQGLQQQPQQQQAIGMQQQFTQNKYPQQPQQQMNGNAGFYDGPSLI